ncbi:Transcription initiation factor IIF subunit beta, partial [Tolypocladium capitatum]
SCFTHASPPTPQTQPRTNRRPSSRAAQADDAAAATMADPTLIKPDPDGEKPAVTTPMEEDDLDEDAGDLEFYDKNATGRQFETLYLARVPKYMWDAWLKMTERLGDDDEIQIGTLRTWNEPVADVNAEGGTRDVTKLRMLLEPSCPEHQLLPCEYDLEILDRNVQNHFVFSEEDLPGYKAKNKARAEAVSAGIPASLLRQRAAQANGQDSGPQRHTYDRRSRYQPYYRKAIPKRTKVFGKIHYDVRVEPRNIQEEERLLAQRLFDAEHSKSKLQIISRNSASSIINPGTATAAQWGGNFIKNAAQPVKPKKGEIFKAARIPKNQLLDLIFDCFRQYQYWSIKALRQKLQQPDTYLRQVLEEVAVLHKSGRFANHYGLSDAYKDKAGSDAKEEAAEAADDGDDDEGEEMEDVLPTQ